MAVIETKAAVEVTLRCILPASGVGLRGQSSPGTHAIAAIMGLPVAELSEEKTLASGAGPLLSSANGVSNREETFGADIERSEGNSSSSVEKKSTMDLSGAKSECTPVAVSRETTILIEGKRIADANGSQIDSVIDKIDDSSKNSREDNPSTEMSPVPLISETLANSTSYEATETDVLGAKSSTNLSDLGDATLITTVPVIQNLADVVEVISVVTSDSEPQHQGLKPPAPGATQAEVSQTMSADQLIDVSKPVSAKPLATTNDDVIMAEGNTACTDLIEGGAQMNELEKMEACSDVKQEAAIGSTVEGSTDNQAGPDIESLLSGSSLQSPTSRLRGITLLDLQ